jgi:molybdate transport system substrate-binding protein
MRKAIVTLLALVFMLHVGAQEKITVAAASNMQFVLGKIKTVFEKESGLRVEVIAGASGKLAAQIREGAPFDVFVSADMVFPQELARGGFTTADPRPYATGLLVLWTLRNDLKPDAGLKVLQTEAVKKIAIANPKTAPYGAAAEEVLKKYDLSEKLRPKLVYGENIGQTQQFVATRAADIGFVAKSLVLSDDLTEKGSWVDIDASAYAPIVQGAVLLKHGSEKPKPAAARFYEFLFSANCRQILKQYGYKVD